MHRPLVAKLRRFDIDLRNGRARRDQLAFLGGPLCEAHTKSKNEVTLGNQLVCDGRGKTAANAKRPWIVRKKSVATDRRRKQRAQSVGKRDKRSFGIRQHGAASCQNERTLRAR